MARAPGKLPDKLISYKTFNKLDNLILYRNWYVWNPHNERFDDYTLYMQRKHYQAAFTRIPEDAVMLRECKLR